MYQTAFTPYNQIYTNHVSIEGISDMKVQHYHDAYEVYLQTDGERYLFLDEICHTLRPGDLYILRPFAIHYTESGGNERFSRYILNFRGEDLRGLLTVSETDQLLDRLDSGIYHLPRKQYEDTCRLFASMTEISERRGILCEKSLCAALLCLLSSLGDFLKEDCVIYNPSDGMNVRPEILKAIHYLNQHYAEDIDLDTISELVHMSKYHFCRQFHEATGATFTEYLYNIRLARVHQMLLQTRLPISQIACRTGFSSAAHLTRRFRAVYQMTPREFRAIKTVDHMMGQ